MARYQVSAPDGGTYEVTAPDDASSEDVIAFAQKQMAPAKPQPGMLESAGRGALQGATFGFSDEVEAGGRAWYDFLRRAEFPTNYNEALKEARASNEAAKKANPGAFLGGEVIGGIGASLIPVAGVAGRAAQVGRVATEAGLGARSLQAAKTGAAYGGAYGFGTAEGGEGNLLQQAGNRALSAVPSAVFGGAVGAATPALVDVGSALVKGATAPIRAAMNPAQTARTKVAEALLRDAPEGASIDGVVGQAGQKLSRAQATKPEVMLADVGGQNTRDLLRSAANMPSQGSERLRKSLDSRQGFQWSRIEKDLADTLADGNQFSKALDDVNGILKDRGSRDFDAAYSAPFNVKAGDPLARFMTERGYLKSIYEKTVKDVEGMTGEDIAKMRPWEALHRVKMQLDTEISKLKSGKGNPADNWDLRGLTLLKREMVDLMGQANPLYKRAMERYGDVASRRSSLERGADEFKTMRAEEIAHTLRGMDRIDQSMFRLGASRSLFEQIEKGNITRDRTESLFSSPEIQKKISALFPDVASRRDFQRRLILEARMADTRKAVQGNSSTAKQLAQGQEAGQPVAAVNAVANAATGHLSPALNYLSRQVQQFSGMTPAVADGVIQTMMSGSSLPMQMSLEKAVQRASREPAFRDMLVRRVIAGATAGRAAFEEPRQ